MKSWMKSSGKFNEGIQAFICRASGACRKAFRRTSQGVARRSAIVAQVPFDSACAINLENRTNIQYASQASYPGARDLVKFRGVSMHASAVVTNELYAFRSEQLPLVANESRSPGYLGR